LPADIPEIKRFFPIVTFLPLTGEMILTLCALGYFIMGKAKMDLLAVTSVLG
jgi:hypothetical protein